MGEKIKIRVRKILNYLKYVILSLSILFVGLLIFPVLSFKLFMETSGRAASGVASMLAPYGLAVAGWTWLIALLVVTAWPFVAFVIWIVKDSRKFKAQGINTHPYLWGLGMIYPLILIVFPLYIIRRNITWRKKLEENNLGINLEKSIKDEEKSKRRKRLVRFGVIILFILFGVIPVAAGLLTQIGIRNRTIGNYLVNFSLSISCASGKSGCDELRPLPKILQNKKIIFNKDTSIQFDPRYRPEIGLNNLDILGSLDASPRSPFPEDIVDPNLGKRGYLTEKEYKIIRAVYHYNCSYCIDSSDYAYVVLGDSNGNRFSSLLAHDYWNPSMEIARTLQWDERVPYDIGRDGELGKLVDIKSTLAQ